MQVRGLELRERRWASGRAGAEVSVRRCPNRQAGLQDSDVHTCVSGTCAPGLFPGIASLFPPRVTQSIIKQSDTLKVATHRS